MDFQEAQVVPQPQVVAGAVQEAQEVQQALEITAAVLE
jgi:hypothetical protein